jgi:hypothetical protein
MKGVLEIDEPSRAERGSVASFVREVPVVWQLRVELRAFVAKIVVTRRGTAAGERAGAG